MAYPDEWTCPVCGAVTSGVKCGVCGYQPPLESGELPPQSVSNDLFGRRIMAFLVDLLIISLISVFLSFLVSYAVNDYSFFKALIIPSIIIGLFLHPVYFLIMELVYGITIGKLVFKLRLSFNNGRVRGAIIRNLSRFIEMIPLYIPSILMIKKSGKRWGDIISGSVIS